LRIRTTAITIENLSRRLYQVDVTGGVINDEEEEQEEEEE
jgi:hypothetical protein